MLLYNTYDGKRADLWSLGALMFWLLAGEEPFTAGIPPDLPQARGPQSLCVLAQTQWKHMKAPVKPPSAGSVLKLSLARPP